MRPPRVRAVPPPKPPVPTSREEAERMVAGLRRCGVAAFLVPIAGGFSWTAVA